VGKLQIKADSFPVGANVHFPTDMNLLWDSARKCIDICAWFYDEGAIKGWRKSESWKREIKKIFRISSRTKALGGKNKEERLIKVVTDYLSLCIRLGDKVVEVLAQTNNLSTPTLLARHIQLAYFHEMLVKHIDLVERRILNEEKIPSAEKLYSIFETHAEWLSKGKQFKPVEIGHNVLIATDQFNFIVHHQVMEKQADAQVTQQLATTLVEKYPDRIQSLSLDKGFYSKENKAFVEQLIPQTVMPKKGKRNKDETLEEHKPDFIKLRNAHSAVESNIHQLNHNGLNRCPDKGIRNFKRYVSWSVLAYNLHKLGEHLSRNQVVKKAA
jgi:transposase, IS5 family